MEYQGWMDCTGVWIIPGLCLTETYPIPRVCVCVECTLHCNTLLLSSSIIACWLLYGSCFILDSTDFNQYTFIRDFRILEVDGERTYVVLAKSHPFSDHPEKSGVIRVDSFEQSCIMQSDGKVGSKGKVNSLSLGVVRRYLFSSSAFMYYYDNPKGMIPTWLINWAAKVQ